VKIKLTLSHLDEHLGALLASSPVTAARHGLLGLVHDALMADAPFMADVLTEGAADVLTELGVATVYEVPAALRARQGRPPTRIVSALRSPDMVDALHRCLYQVSGGNPDVSALALEWGPLSDDPGAVAPLRRDDLGARTELVDQLRVRTAEIIAGWRQAQMGLARGGRAMDGRTLATAARVWQIPLVTGELPEVAPTAAAALYPNRLGRSAAAVIFSKVNAAISANVGGFDVSAIFEPLALLVAIGESISIADFTDTHRKLALKGALPVRVRCGEPLTDMALDVHSWWPVFSSWGSSARRDAVAIPTAWRLSGAEADVLVWALCSVAVRLAVASTAPRSGTASITRFDWSAHVAEKSPQWEAGAASLWSLMQRGRQVEKRTAWPETIFPALKDAATWPWRSDTLVPVPVTTEGVPA
jgi:hypothetical protein